MGTHHVLIWFQRIAPYKRRWEHVIDAVLHLKSFVKVQEERRKEKKSGYEAYVDIFICLRACALRKLNFIS